MKTKAVIIGAGEMGTALNNLVSGPNAETELWDTDPRKTPSRKRLDDIVPSADFVFICVPSWAIRDVLTSIFPFVSKRTAVISLTKGIDNRSSQLADKLMGEILPPGTPIAILGGAMIAEEIVRGKKVRGVLASSDKSVYKKLAKLFKGSACEIEFTTDVRGVAVAGVMKNIYAIGLGIADGFKFSPAAKNRLIEQALKEMFFAAELLGGKPKTIEGRAGKEDLIETGSSQYSRNHQVGLNLAAHKRDDLKSEGAVSLPMMFSILGSEVKNTPFLNTLYEIVVKNADPGEIAQIAGEISS